MVLYKTETNMSLQTIAQVSVQYFTIIDYNCENAESLHNRKNKALLEKEKSNIRPLTKEKKEFQSILMHSICINLSIYKTKLFYFIYFLLLGATSYTFECNTHCRRL